MPGVNATITQSFSAKLIGVNDLGSPAFKAELAKVREFSQGTLTVDQADLLFADSRTLAASATENLDMSGVLVSPLGGTFVAAEIVAMYFEASAANTNDVVLFGAATNFFNGPLSGATPKLALRPGEAVTLTNRQGWTVTPATGDLILVANGAAGTSVDYKVCLIGRSVAA